MKGLLFNILQISCTLFYVKIIIIISSLLLNNRVAAFQARFDELWNRYETYSSGETLFGIPVREYPELQHRKRELNLLQKLYSLYSQVMRTIDSYYSIAWSDIDIESIVAELTEFQNK